MSESISKRKERHQRHQAMLQEHSERKAIARERHHLHWHRIKIIPINLI